MLQRIIEHTNFNIIVNRFLFSKSRECGEYADEFSVSAFSTVINCKPFIISREYVKDLQLFLSNKSKTGRFIEISAQLGNVSKTFCRAAVFNSGEYKI